MARPQLPSELQTEKLGQGGSETQIDISQKADLKALAAWGRGIDPIVVELGLSVLAAGDIVITFDETPKTGFSLLNGGTITDGALDFPTVAARYPFMATGDDLVLPDFRGKFLRAWADGSVADPDAASRTARAGDGATGDLPATNQPFGLESHSHTLQAVSEDGDLMAPLNNFFGALSDLYRETGTLVGLNSSTVGTVGGNETRPINIYVTFQMKMG